MSLGIRYSFWLFFIFYAVLVHVYGGLEAYTYIAQDLAL
jgi:hypothetical protein